MRKYEYRIISCRATGVPIAGEKEDPWYIRISKGLDELGKEGWELCAVYGDYLYFKRRLRCNKCQR